jgi:hypothetical protein
MKKEGLTVFDCREIKRAVGAPARGATEKAGLEGEAAAGASVGTLLTAGKSTSE